MRTPALKVRLLRRTFAPQVMLALLTLCLTTHAGELPTASPDEVGMSSRKLARVAPAMQQLVDERKVAGAITIVARQGKIVLFESVGTRDGAANEPMDRDTIVRIYSMTKPVTSVAIMMLAEEDVLELDESVVKYLPELAQVQVFVKSQGDELQTEPLRRAMTVRDFLRHTSGLTYGFFGDTVVDKRYIAANVLDHDGTLADMSRKLGELPLLYQPGTRFNYSISTDLLGRLVEALTHQSLDEFFQQRIFLPLDMHDTGFFVPAEKLHRFSANFGPDENGGLKVIDSPTQSRYQHQPRLLSGGGGLVSTARDYMRFCQMLLNRGQLDGKRLLRESTVNAMAKNQLPDEAYPISLNGRRPGIGFGLGFSVVVEKTAVTPGVRVGEYGWGGAASTHFWISPPDDLAVVVLTQQMPFTFQMEFAVKPLIYDAISAESSSNE